MNDELKQLIEDAAKLLGLQVKGWIGDKIQTYNPVTEWAGSGEFNPCDPERGDLMKVAMVAELNIDGELEYVAAPPAITCEVFSFTRDDHDSLTLAVLRAASAVWHALGGE